MWNGDVNMSNSKPKVLILGTFHMAEEGGEALFEVKRQAEIQGVVEKLTRFQPTKIALEWVVEQSASLNEEYEQYKVGNFPLKMNEIYQIGFRLGEGLQHTKVFPIDWMGEADKDYSEIDAWMRANQPQLANELFEGLKFPVLTEDKTIIDYYKELNEPNLYNQLHTMYINLARVGHFNKYIGIDWLSWWYKRNLILFSNLTRLMETDKERIIFIVGVSHVSIVAKFLEESGLCEVVDTLSYLQ